MKSRVSILIIIFLLSGVILWHLGHSLIHPGDHIKMLDHKWVVIFEAVLFICIYLFWRYINRNDRFDRFFKPCEASLFFKQEDKRLKQNEESLESAQKELLEAIRQQQGLTFKFKKVNQQYIHTLCDGGLLYQVGLLPEEVVGKGVEGLHPGVYAERAIDYYEQAWRGIEHVEYETKIGETTLLVSLRPIKQYGEVIEVIGSCVDITQRILAEKELLATKQLLESFIRHNTDAIELMDIDGRIISINHASEHIFGYSESEAVGKYLTDYLPLDMIEVFNIKLQSVLEGQNVNGCEFQRLKKDGTIAYISTTITAVPGADGEIAYLACTSRDIAERKRAEASLRDSEEKLRLITDYITDIVCILNEKGIIEYISPSSRAILGYDPEDLVGENVFTKMLPEDLLKTRKNFRELLVQKNKKLAEFRVYDARDRVITIEATAVPVIYEKNQHEKVIVVARDITERKETEEIIRQTEKLSVVGQLAAGVAHEIRNPLTSLKGFVQLIKSKVTDYHEYYDIMLSELERINYIVSEFMVISKPTMLQFEKKSIDGILGDVISLLSTQAIISNITIHPRKHTAYCQLECDENQLKQVFINLLKNAIEAMSSGGEIYIDISDDSSQYLRITFVDQGCGIPKDKIDNIGKPFYTTKEKGTGLGLMICNKIIENHRGRLEIESELGIGTTIHVVLPRHRH